MKCLSTVILAVSISFVASTAPAADYELFGATSKLNYYAVERFEYKNNKVYHCSASIDTQSHEPMAQCTETPGVAPERPRIEEPNLQSTFTNVFGHVPQGFWQLDRTTGKTEFCTLGSRPCVDVTPK